MTFRERQVTLVGPDGEAQGRLAWWRRGDRDWLVSLTGPAGDAEAGGTDLFTALTALRDRLTPRGWTVAVHGTRPDTRPDDRPTRVRVGDDSLEMLADITHASPTRV